MPGGRLFASGAAVCALAAVSGPASVAAKTTPARHRTTVASILANCSGQAPSQFCPRPASPPTTFASITVRRRAVKITYVAGATHCSQVSAILYVDGTQAGRTSALGRAAAAPSSSTSPSTAMRTGSPIGWRGSWGDATPAN